MKRSALFFLLLVVFLPLAAQEQLPPLTFNDAADPTLMQAMSVPRFWWLNDNTAIIFDTRKPPADRILERFDPKTGNRTPFMDVEKVNKLYVAETSMDRFPPFPPVPNQFSKDGKRALYVIRGDILVLDIPTSSFIRVTKTLENEKNVVFSPDGKKVGFVREKNLFAYDLDTRKEMQITSDGGGTILNATLSWVYWEEIFGRQDAAYWWSPDSRSIAFLRSDETHVSEQSYTDIEPWTPTVTKQRYPKVGEKNPGVRVLIAEIGGGVVEAKIGQDRYEYIVRVNWFPDSRRVCIRTLNRLQTELDFWFVDSKSGDATHIMTDKNEAWINMSDDLFFLKDGKHFIATSERDSYEHLYRFTMDGKLVNQITKGGWALRSSGGGPFWIRQAVTGIDEERGIIYFTSLEKNSLERHLYSIRINGKDMKRLTSGDGTHAITMSPNTEYYFNRYSNVTTPPSLTLFETRRKKQTVLAASDLAGFKKYDVVYPELLSVPARDGYLLPASIIRPRNADPAKKYPVIVEVYGGPSAPSVANNFSFGTITDNGWLNEGYIIFRVDNRAATARSKKLENLLYRNTPGEVELNDVVDAVQWLKKHPGIDPDRFGITGWSGGGTNTILAMTRSKEFKAGIAGGAVTDFRFYDTKWGEALMSTEAENKEGFEAVSLLKFAKDLHGRLLLVHGTHDDNVHIQNIWRFIDELIKADKVFDLMVYPMRGHGVGDPAGRKHFRSLQMDFWNRHLKK